MYLSKHATYRFKTHWLHSSDSCRAPGDPLSRAWRCPELHSRLSVDAFATACPENVIAQPEPMTLGDIAHMTSPMEAFCG